MSDRDRSTTGPRDWQTEESFWRENYRTRPYVQQGRDFEEYRPGYQYGYESANRMRGRDWNDVEPELKRGWDTYEGRGQSRSKWEEIKDSVRDAWNRATGDDDRTTRR